MASLAARIVPLLPPALLDVAYTAHAWRARRIRLGGRFRAELARLRESEWWDAGRLAELQAERLREVVVHAHAHVPHVRRTFDRLGLGAGDIRTPEDLQRLPLLSRDEVRAAGKDLRSEAFRTSSLLAGFTGGTGGARLRTWLTPEAVQLQWAVWWRHRTRLGLEPGDRHATFGYRLPTTAPPRAAGIDDLLTGSGYVPGQALRPEALHGLVEWLRRRKFTFLAGYPTALAVVARHLRDRGATLPGLRATCCGSETLQPAVEDLLREGLGAPVTDVYGCAEACIGFARCERGRYHEDPEIGIVELLPVEGSSDPRLVRLVATGLGNLAMPLLRYEVGDVGVLAEGPCPCGRPTRTLERIEGRADDVLRTPDGRIVSGLNQVFKRVPGLDAVQVQQRALDEVVALYVPAPRRDPDTARILLEELRARLGPSVRLTAEEVAAIPRAPGGKARAVVSLVGTTDGGTT